MKRLVMIVDAPPFHNARFPLFTIVVSSYLRSTRLFN